jgi:hypothetical protein
MRSVASIAVIPSLHLKTAVILSLHLKTDRALGDQWGDQWLVSEGLRAGDRLVVDGQQRAAPGLGVIVVPLRSANVVALAAHRNP